MLASSDNIVPLVSIILPTYNRARFLPQAFASIKSQTFTDWELIVIDDGSTDNTRELVAEMSSGMGERLKYVYQQNAGPAAARNCGVDLALGAYCAFYDSDDLWLHHHLNDCVAALQMNSDVDWVYSSCRIVNFDTAEEIAPTTFYVNGHPRPFMKLKCRRSSGLNIIDDRNAIRCQLLYGLYCGLQGSLIRARVFEQVHIPLQRIGEDQVFLIEALSSNFRLAYLNNVHVVYRVHEENSSSSANGVSLEKQAHNYEEIITGFEQMKSRVSLRASERLALRICLSRECFWHIGYSLHWQNGRRREALQSFRKGLRYWPWDWRQWKTYALAYFRTLVQS